MAASSVLLRQQDAAVQSARVLRLQAEIGRLLQRALAAELLVETLKTQIATKETS